MWFLEVEKTQKKNKWLSRLSTFHNSKIPSFTCHLKEAEMKVTCVRPLLRVSQKS